MTRQDYYPVAIPAQVLWLQHFAGTLPDYNGVLTVDAALLNVGIADARWLAYVVGGWRTELRSFAPAGTAAIEQAQTGRGLAPMQLPLYHLPELPEGVAPQPPGALTRIFKLVQTIKCRPGYTQGIGRLLGLLPRQDSAVHPVPTVKLKLQPGPQNQQVALRYSRHGHYAILIQSRRGGAEWEELAIAAQSLYTDARPLLHPGQPELRDYRFRFWDNGQPTGDWSDVMTVTVGV